MCANTHNINTRNSSFLEGFRVRWTLYQRVLLCVQFYGFAQGSARKDMVDDQSHGDTVIFVIPAFQVVFSGKDRASRGLVGSCDSRILVLQS